VVPELAWVLAGVAIGAIVAAVTTTWRARALARSDMAGPGVAPEPRAPAVVEALPELMQIADLAGLAVLQLDDALVVRAASLSAETLLRRRGSLVGLSAIEAFADHRAEQVVVAARSAGTAQGEMSLGNDPRAPILLRARRSDHQGVVVVLEDLSELRRLQRVRSDFVDNVSHELRTPLTNVRLLVETLDLELGAQQLDPVVRSRIEAIDRETQHLVELVNDLLDLSRLEQGASPLKLQDLDAAAVVASALERIRVFAERQDVSVTSDLPVGLPRVRGDPERLSQLLLNLLHNAVKFSPPGSSVRVGGRAQQGDVVISVVDYGSGISRADLERVFERFYKVDRARSRSAGGTGLGLAIARHIAEAHGGRIWAESEEGRGSTFSFALPAAP
jgi:two-component system phosphate regulon sensor histidine kinase PhoR